MKKKYGKSQGASRSDAQRKRLIALLIAILVVVGGVGVALSAAQNGLDNPQQMTEEQAQQADTVAASGGTNKELPTSTAPIGQTGATLYNSEAFLQTGLTPDDLAEPLQAWVESSFASLNGLQIRFTGVTQGTSNAESILWFDTNNTEHQYLRAVYNGTEIAVSSVSKEVYAEATKNMYKAATTQADAAALEVLSRIQFFDMTNCPIAAEDVAVAFDNFAKSAGLDIKNVSYVQSSGSTGGMNVWFSTDNEQAKYVLCQVKGGNPAWATVENLGSLPTPVTPETNADPAASADAANAQAE